MTLVWDRLEAQENSQPGSVPWTILKLRSDYPDDSSTELAARLSEKTGREFRPDATRQQLRRARVRFWRHSTSLPLSEEPDAGQHYRKSHATIGSAKRGQTLG